MVKSVRALPFPALGLLLACVWSLTACNFQEMKGDDKVGFGEFTDADLNYKEINERILKPYCLTCHAVAAGNRGGLNLETYSAVQSHISEIRRTVLVDKTMPPATETPLPAEASSMLEKWLNIGAPE